MSKGKKIAIGVAVVVAAPPVIAGAISGTQQAIHDQATAITSSPSPTPSHAQAAAPPATRGVKSTPARATPVAEPTFNYPGDPQCAITYRDRGDGSMSWTATVTVAGELITHASDTDGSIYRHDAQVTPGPNSFSAPVPLAKISDIGGVLYQGSTSYGCSIAPAR